MTQLFGKAFRKGTKCLSGLCFAEVCRKSKKLLGNLHFHILLSPVTISEGKTLDAESIRSILEPVLEKVVEKLTDETPQKRRITNMRSVNIRPYKKRGRLAGYCTKEYERRGAEANDFWGMLDFHGVVGLNIPLNRKSSDAKRGLF